LTLARELAEPEDAVEVDETLVENNGRGFTDAGCRRLHDEMFEVARRATDRRYQRHFGHQADWDSADPGDSYEAVTADLELDRYAALEILPIDVHRNTKHHATAVRRLSEDLEARVFVGPFPLLQRDGPPSFDDGTNPLDVVAEHDTEPVGGGGQY
ncbi:MAG: hypothetical protein ABEK12_03980, partial [Candidatus Nanohaloarchaea archaeon]